jgi:hypothetical protein
VLQVVALGQAHAVFAQHADKLGGGVQP